MTHAPEAAVRRTYRYAAGAGIVTLVVAISVLAGWTFDLEFLKSVVPGRGSMMPMTALSFALLGAAITSRAMSRDETRFALVAFIRAASLAVVVIAAGTVFEYLSGIDLTLDRWLFSAKVSTDGSTFDGRMAHAAAVSLLCLGLAILFATRRPASIPLSNVLAIIAASIGMLGVAGYLYDASALYGFSGYASVSLPTAVLLLVAASGILAVSPNRGVPLEILSRHSGGVMARRLLPAAILVPFVFGWLEIGGERIGLYSDSFGEALFASLNLTAFVTLIWLDARLLNRIDRQRETADAMARAALAESERRYRTMAESLPQLVWTCTADGVCDYLSPQWVTYTGLRAAEHLGTGWADPMHPDDRQAVFAQWTRAARSGDRLDAEVRLRGADGTYRWFRTLATPLRDDDRQIVKWFGTSTDIDDQKRAEAALQALTAALEQRVEERTRELQAAKERAESADRLKTDFIMSMSHELRTPLNAIIGFSGTLLMRMPGPLTTEQESQLRLVQSNGRHLLMLISDVLDVARIEAGTFEVGRDLVDGAAVVRDVVAELAPLAREKGLTLDGTMPPFSVELTTDHLALRQILINLTSNAIKFTERGGVTVTIEEARRDDRDVVDISVVDTGIGIAAIDLPRLFTKFGQLSRAGTTSQGGTGLGLYLSQTLAERLGGRITVASAPGQGSCFVLTLPI